MNNNLLGYALALLGGILLTVLGSKLGFSKLFLDILKSKEKDLDLKSDQKYNNKLVTEITDLNSKLKEDFEKRKKDEEKKTVKEREDFWNK